MSAKVEYSVVSKHIDSDELFSIYVFDTKDEALKFISEGLESGKDLKYTIKRTLVDDGYRDYFMFDPFLYDENHLYINDDEINDEELS